MLRVELAELVQEVWCSYGTPDSTQRAECCQAAEVWLDLRFLEEESD
jgi:hypothetical protein